MLWDSASVKQCILLDGAQAHLNERVNQRLELALFPSFYLCFCATCLCQDKSPKVDGMHILPVVYLPI